MEQIREQVMRVSEDQNKELSKRQLAPLDEDEEFKLAEKLAASFCLSHDSKDIDP